MRRSPGAAYAFTAFPLAILTTFVVAPAVIGLALSLCEWDGGALIVDGAIRWPRPVGLANFARMLRDPDISAGLVNTIVFAFGSVVPSVLVGFLLAVGVNARWFVGRAWVQTLLFMPTMVSIVAVGFVWRWVLNGEAGLLTAGIRAARLAWVFGPSGPPDWLTDGRWPLFWIIAISAWRQVGFCVVLYIAALRAIPPSLYEAAEIDGAGAWRRVTAITWPQCAPMTAFLMITGLITALQVFDITYVITGDQPTAATTVLNYEIYQQFTRSAFGYAAAIGALILALTLALTAVQWAVFSRAGAS